MNKPGLTVLVIAAFAANPTLALSQGAVAGTIAPGAATAVARARAMASDGNASGARGVLDSLLAMLPAGAPEAALALHTRAGMAESTANAERDYRRVVVEYPMAPVAADATLRLAQIELQRGDNAYAIRRLERLRAEQPAGGARGRTSFWVARAYLEGGDASRGCAALADARAQVDAADVEVRNQVEYYAPRCHASTVVGAVAPDSASRTAPPAATAVTTAPPPTRASAHATTHTAAHAAAHATFTVQVAALGQRAAATVMAKRLRAQGFDARVDGSAAPYRVRVGRYATRAAADVVAARVRARKHPGLVVETAPR